MLAIRLLQPRKGLVPIAQAGVNASHGIRVADRQVVGVCRANLAEEPKRFCFEPLRRVQVGRSQRQESVTQRVPNLLILSRGLLVVALKLLDSAQVLVRVGELRIDLQCSLDLRDGPVVLSASREERSEIRVRERG